MLLCIIQIPLNCVWITEIWPIGLSQKKNNDLPRY